MNDTLFLITMLDVVFFLLSMYYVCNHTMHMFQLNYYRASEQFRWFRKNNMSYLGHMTVAVLMLINVLIPWSPYVKAWVMLPLLLLACVISRPKKSKKPLVRTDRVKRMDITIGVLLALLTVFPIALFGRTHQSYIYFTMAMTYLLSPLIVLLANLINRPIELSVNRYYLNDAKKILKASPELTIIGITGSYGKTSVKYYLTTLLRSKFNTLMTPESFNTPMGIVKTIRNDLKPTDEIFVCEMGAKWNGDIKELCDLVHPKHGIITSVGPQHLESMGSLDNIKKTKFALADSIPEDGMLFLNGNDENIADYIADKNYSPVKYGLADNEDEAAKLDYYAHDINADSRGSSFTVTAPNGESERFSTRLIGKQNVLNIVGAISVCNKIGIPLSELKGQVRKLEGVPHRLELNRKNGVTIIDDAYNSNPHGTKVALDALSMFDGYKILVTPGMVELGEKQDELNREFGLNAASVADYVVLVGFRGAEPIKQGLLDGGFSENRIFVAGGINEALAHVNMIGSEGKEKVILLENDLPDNY